MRNVMATLFVFGLMTAAVVWLDEFSAQSLQGRAHVIDGDSIRLNGDEIRLEGIDAPELYQPCWRNGREWACGRDAKRALLRMVTRKTVTCRSSSTDQYDRKLATCSVDGKSLNASLVRQGWAVDYGGYGGEEAQARAAKAGIWSSQFDVPREWRDYQK